MSAELFDRLLVLVSEREEHDPLTNRYAYLSGRIDECCFERGVSDGDRDKAVAAVAAAARASRTGERAAA